MSHTHVTFAVRAAGPQLGVQLVRHEAVGQAARAKQEREGASEDDRDTGHSASHC